MTDLTSHVLGPYRLLAKVGDGGMATVYRAYDGRSGRLVALKVLSPHLWHDQESVERFRREARNAAGLRHPNVVPVYESGVSGGYPYLAMAYVEGGSLTDWLAWQQGPLPLPRAAGILDQVAAALDYAHAGGLVHRDVKPSNILLTRDGQALLADFGIAKAAWDSRLTQTGVRVGTPAYMAPEQARGQPVDRRTDVYALGVVLYEMVIGRPPFQGNTDAVLYQHVHEPPPPPCQLNPALPPAAERAILRALAKDPARRYRTAGELAAAFRRAVEPATRVARPGPVSPPTPGKRRVRPATPARPSLSTGQILALAGAVAVVLVVAALALLMRPRLPALFPPLATVTTMPSPSPSPTLTVIRPPAVAATPLPAPEPTGPEDGAVYYNYNSQEVTLAWTWSSTLEADQRFAVVVEDGNGARVLDETVGPGEEMAHTFPTGDVGVGEYRWTVWVERDVEGKWEVVAQAEEWRTLRVRPPATATPIPPTPPPATEIPTPPR